MAKDAMKEHHKYKSCILIVIGILIILNAIYGWFSWALFVGGAFILVGIISKIATGCCKKK